MADSSTVYVKLPDLEKTDEKPNCGIEIDQCSYSIIDSGCTEFVSIGGESASISYALANDGVYIGSITVPDDVAVSLVIITNSGVRHEISIPKTAQNYFIPFNRNDPADKVFFKFYAETPSGPVTVATNEKSAGWSGYVRTGILEFEIRDSKVVAVRYLSPDKLGRKEIEIIDAGNLDVFHFITENNTDKFYKIEKLPAVIPWGGSYLDVFPVKISGVGTLDLVVNDKGINLYHTGALILSESFSGIKIDVKTCEKAAVEIPPVAQCTDTPGCWYVNFNDISLGDAGCLVELSVNDSPVFPSKDTLESPSGTIWENLFAEAVYTDDFSKPVTVTAPIKEILSSLPDKLQSSLGSYFYVMYPMYGGDKKPLRAVVRSYSGNQPIGMNVYKSGVWSLLSYSGSQIAPLNDSGYGTIYVTNPDGNTSLVSASPLYWLSMSASLLGDGWSISSIKVLYAVHSESGRIHYVFSLNAPQDGSSAEYKIDGIKVAAVSSGGIQLLVGQVSTQSFGKALFVPLAVLVDAGFQLSSADGSISTTNYTLAYKFSYSADFVFGFKDAGDGSNFTVIAPAGLEFGMIDKNGKIVSNSQDTLSYGPVKVSAPLPLTDDFGIVAPNGSLGKWLPLNQDAVSGASASVGWSVAVKFGSEIEKYGNIIPAILRTTYTASYGSTAKTFRTDLSTLANGILVADDVAYMASLSADSKAVKVSPNLVLIGSNHTGYAAVPLSSSSTLSTPLIYVNKSNASIDVQNMSDIPLKVYLRVSASQPSGVVKKEYLITQMSNSVTFSTVLTDLISLLSGYASDLELVELVLRDESTGQEITVDSKYATMLQDSITVAVIRDASGNPTSIAITWSVGDIPTGTSLTVLTPSLTEEPEATTNTWKLTSDYVYIALVSKSNFKAGVLFLYTVKTASTISNIDITGLVKVDCSYGAYCKVTVDESLQNPVLYRLNKDGSTEKLDDLTIYRPGIYVLKGQLNVMGQSVDVSAVISVKGWEVNAVPDQKLLSIAVYGAPDSTGSLTVKSAPGYLYVPSKFDEDLLEEVFSCSGNWIEWSGTGDYLCYTISLDGDTEQNCIVMDKVKAYGPIGAVIVAVVLLGAMVSMRK